MYPDDSVNQCDPGPRTSTPALTVATAELDVSDVRNGQQLKELLDHATVPLRDVRVTIVERPRHLSGGDPMSRRFPDAVLRLEWDL